MSRFDALIPVFNAAFGAVTPVDGVSTWAPGSSASLQAVRGHLGEGLAVAVTELLQALPDSLQAAIAAVSVQSVSVNDTDSPSLQLSLALDTWQPDAELQLHGLTLTLTWSGATDFAATLAAKGLGLKGASLALDVSVSLPELLLEAQLSPAQVQGAEGLLPPPVGGGSPSLQDLSVRASLQAPWVVLHLQVADLLRLNPLTVSELDVVLRFGRVQTLSASAWVGALTAWTELRLPWTTPEASGELRLGLLGQVTSGGDWTLAGGLAPEDGAQLGALMGALSDSFQLDPKDQTVDLSALKALPLDRLFLTWTHKDKASAFRFDAAMRFPVSDTDTLVLELALSLDLVGEAWKLSVAGVLRVGVHELEVDFADASGAGVPAGSLQVLAARYADKGRLELADLATGLPEVRDLLSGVSLSLEGALVATVKAGATPRRYVVGVGLEAAIDLDLASLPLVGELLAGEGHFSIDQLRFFLASDPIWADELAVLPASTRALLPDAPTPPAGQRALAFDKGANLRARLSLGSETWVLPQAKAEAPAAAADASTPSSAGASAEDATSPAEGGAPAPAPTDSGSWIEIGRSFGPLTVARVGADYHDGAAWFLVDASFQAGVLTLTAEGLGIGSSLTHFEPQLCIRGMSLSWSSPPIALSGGFVASPDMKSFAGDALLHTGLFSLSAIGAYADHGDFKSAFVYASVDAPIGGPPPFFVTGLAAGFGTNSRVLLPEVDAVSSHLLVQAASPPATGSPLSGSDPSKVLDQLNQGSAIAVEQGQDWFAAGVRFTSFDLIDSLALVIVEFGNELELALLGQSRVTLPPPPAPGQTQTDPFALLEMGLEVVVQPARGVFKAAAVITPASFLLSQDCRPHGGFAFYCWFGPSPHAGDFVLTVGGYHPKFPVPARYPRVPRLGFTWTLSDALRIEGDAYFALTPSAVMAGGRLAATFHAGPIKAWFIAWMDALIQWAPFHFLLDIGVTVGVSLRVDLGFVSFTLTAEIGAELHLWGPPIGGRVRVSLYIVSFTIPFGADEDAAKPPLTWTDSAGAGFAQTLLPHADDDASKSVQPQSLLTIRVVGGLAGTLQRPDGSEDWIVRPDEAAFVLSSAVPITGVEEAGAPVPLTGASAAALAGPIPIRPMQRHLDSSVLTLSLNSADKAGEAFHASFACEAIQEEVPAAKWGAALGKEGLTPQRATDTCTRVTGVRATPHPPALTPADDPLLIPIGAVLALADQTPPSPPRIDAPAAASAPAPQRGPSRDAVMRSLAAAMGQSADTRASLLDAMRGAGFPLSGLSAADPFGGAPERWLGGDPLLTPAS